MNRTESSPVVDRIIAWSINRPLPPLTRYLLATLLVAVTALVRAMFITTLLPWLIFMPVTLLIALTMGRRTGLYAVLLSAVAAMLTIGHPDAVFWLTGQQWIASVLYVLISSGIVVVAAELRAAFRRAQQASGERERLHARLVDKEEQTRLLNHELGHRLKNLLTIVQAVATQTLRQSGDLRTASDALSFRLAAFGRAADVLTAASWQAADLHALAQAALGSHDSLAARFRLEGPPIRFNSRIALALALAFHELATNATKYGALSNDDGHVQLRWSIVPGPDHDLDERRFSLTWREVGGPPVRPPTHRGFGSLMIERSLRSYFPGTIATDYAPDGVVFSIDASLAGMETDAAPA